MISRHPGTPCAPALPAVAHESDLEHICEPMHVIDALEETPAQLAAVLATFSPAALAYLPPDWNECPGEQFSALGHVCHMRDIERDGYHVRFARTLGEVEPDLVSIDGYALALERRYDEDDVERALAEFRAARAETLRRVRAFGPDGGARAATFGVLGRVTATGLLHVLRSHDLQHLACLHWLLGRMAGEAGVTPPRAPRAR